MNEDKWRTRAETLWAALEELAQRWHWQHGPAADARDFEHCGIASCILNRVALAAIPEDERSCGVFIVIYRGENDSYWHACLSVYDKYGAAVLEAAHLEKQGLKTSIIRVGVPIRDAREEHHAY